MFRIICVVYQDCCQDFSEVCPNEIVRSRNNTRFQLETPSCETLEINEGMDWKYKYLMISTCQGERDPCLRTVDSPYGYLPMVDTKSGHHYINVKCAICNNVNTADLVPWTTLATCRRKELSIGSTKKIPIRNLDTEILLNEAAKYPLKTAKCRLEFRPPRRMSKPRRCIDMEKIIRECPETCSNVEIKKACTHGHINYILASRKIYRNYHCFLCHEGFKNSSDVCEFGSVIRNQDKTDPWIERYSMQILFDFDPRDGLIVGTRKVATPKCPPYHKWSHFKCRAVFRRTTPSTIFSEVDRSNPHSRSGKPTEEINFEVLSNFSVRVYKSISAFLQENHIEAQFDIHINLTNNVVNISLFVHGIKPKSKLSNTDYIQLNISSRIQNISSYFNLTRSMDINVIVYLNAKNSQSFQKQCTYIKYDSSEYEMLNNETLSLNNKNFNVSSWFIFNGSLWLCASPSETLVDTLSTELGLTTLCLLAVSALALTIRILLHLVLSELQNAAGRVQTCLAISMLLAILSLLVGPILTPRTTLCHIAGLVSHWALLAMFFWMTAVSVDIWRMVWLSSRFYKIYHRKTTFLKYSLFAWVSPTLIVLTSELVNYLSPDDRFRPQYGFDLCWINQRYALLTMFAVPVALSLTANMVLFILSAVFLNKNSGKAITHTGKAGYSFSLYLKLFVLMGLTWIIGIVAEVSGSEVMFYIFTVMNASQGILLTLGSLCSSQSRTTITSKVKASAAARLISRLAIGFLALLLDC